MQAGSEIPPIPRWFHDELVALFSLYPNAAVSQVVPVTWWRHLHRYPREALVEAFGKAPQSQPAEKKAWPPSAEQVRDLAAAWRAPTPKADLARPALEEPAPELPPELEEIRRKQRIGELTPNEAAKAYLRWTVERLP